MQKSLLHFRAIFPMTLGSTPHRFPSPFDIKKNLCDKFYKNNLAKNYTFRDFLAPFCLTYRGSGHTQLGPLPQNAMLSKSAMFFLTIYAKAILRTLIMKFYYIHIRYYLDGRDDNEKE